MTSRPRLACLLATTLIGCSPTLDWRETRFEGSGIIASFPCKPDRQARAVALGATQVRMQMLVCSSAGATFALTFFDVADPGGVTSALADLRAAAVANLGNATVQASALDLPGMTPNPQAVRLRLAGRKPDGAAAQEITLLFVRGLRVYQASVLGEALAPAAVDPFVAGLKFPA